MKDHDSDGDVNLNTFLGHAIWQGKKSIYCITFHSLDRMTWDENGSYYLGDLHLLKKALVSKQFQKLNSGNYILPPPPTTKIKKRFWGLGTLWHVQ